MEYEVNKRCTKCGYYKPLSKFYRSKRDGHRARCKACEREDCKIYAKTGYYARYQRRYSQKPKVKALIRIRKAEYRQRPYVRIKNMARWYTNHEIRAGRINREPCALCGKEQGEAHHPDYNLPFIIVWLCADCHRRVHLKGGR